MKYAIYIKCLYKYLPLTALQPIGSFRPMQLIYDCKGGGGFPGTCRKRKKIFSNKFTRSKTHFSFLLLKAEIST